MNMTGQDLFEMWRRHANAVGLRLAYEPWHRQHIKRQRAWEMLALELSSGVTR